LGLFASVAAFIASGEMAVAYFKAHVLRALWPIEKPRRASGSLLLPVSLHRSAGPGDLELGSAAQGRSYPWYATRSLILLNPNRWNSSSTRP
jgi:putative oxidoreductase